MPEDQFRMRTPVWRCAKCSAKFYSPEAHAAHIKSHITLPNFFTKFLSSLDDDQNTLVYTLACNDTGTSLRDAIMDIVSPRATANPE
jgi:hypothetical protein